VKKKMTFRRFLWIAAGIICVILGTLGIFLPVLPTTVFFLLAAAAFAHGSDRLYFWIMNHRIFGAFISNYRRYHAVPVQTKIVSVSFLWLMIGSSAIFAVTQWWLRGLLVLIAIAVTWHIAALKTLTPQMVAEILRLEKDLDVPVVAATDAIVSKKQKTLT
jgi:uncharacterized membrane protein YbaN (DUF454 family)